METKFYYIHGLHGSSKSKKFLDLKQKYSNIECLEWSIHDDINVKLSEWKEEIYKNKNNLICVIASSTGANLAYQLRNSCKPNWFSLVLINPLFDVADIFNPSIMPENVKVYLEKITKHSNSLLFFGGKDSVLNNSKYHSKDNYIGNNNQIIVDKNDNHSFENLKNYYHLIDNLVDAIYL